jgi:ribosomal protein S18 acetylase RimI-like enzyme
MSLYSKYLEERTNTQIIETPQGFCTYKFLEDNTCYLEDIFTLPEFRRSNVASNLADQVCEIAKAKGCTHLIGSVVPSAKNSTASISVLIAYGMKVDRSMNDFIVFKKEI